jgi:nanoRNase/pAp phosphatase (c-di-AMP/oligoRNAs hydrolase)
LTKFSSVRARSQRISALLSKSRLLERKYNSIFVFTHRQADPDALCSAYAVSELILKTQEKKNPNKPTSVLSARKIIAPQGASSLGVNVCKALGIPFEEKIEAAEIEKADLIIAVDVGENELLEPYLTQITNSKAMKILIDHHSSAADDKALSKERVDPFDYRFVDSKATSTCEIVTSLYPPGLLDLTVSKILLVGLLFDSQHLSIATARTLEGALKLVKKGARIDEAKELLRSKPERSEIIARLKSSQRLKYREIGNYILAETQVSSFQAAVARMLLDIGADVGIAFGEHEDETRISIRTTQRFFRETGIDMGVLLSRLSKERAMKGGGHSTAASLSGKGSTAASMERIISELAKRLPEI